MDGNNAATCTDANHVHPGAASPLVGTAEFCGQCHDVTNPVYDRLDPATGLSLGFHMPIERTFSEWKASDYADGKPLAERCQSCHMPKPADTAGATTVGGVCRPFNQNPFNRGGPGQEIHQHEFVGGNAWMPAVFANVQAPVVGDGGVSGDPAWFYKLVTGAYNLYSPDRQAAYRFIAQAAANKLATAGQLMVWATGDAMMRAPTTTTSGGTLALTVHVENHTGHKLPTGYPEGRRMWIQVFAAVPAQAIASPFFQSGAYDDTTGILTKDSQIKIYQAELSRAGMSAAPNPPEFHFAANQIVWKDNRIPPVGFDPNAPNFAEMAPVGATYPLINGKLQSWDDTNYTVPVPVFATGDVKVTVKLVYQTASKDYIDFLRTANTTNGRGQDITTIWQNHGRGKFVEMASTTFTVANTQPCVPSVEICDGKDNDCDGVADENNVCGDLGVPTADDLSVATTDDLSTGADDLATAAPTDDLGALGVKGHGCGVSVAGNDWSDLGPLALLLCAAILLSGRRRARRSLDSGPSRRVHRR